MKDSFANETPRDNVVDALAGLRTIRRFLERSSLTMRDFSDLQGQFDLAEQCLEHALADLPKEPA